MCAREPRRYPQPHDRGLAARPARSGRTRSASSLGIVVACLVTEYRLRQPRRRARGRSLDIAVWAVPFGIIGARIYHVITSPEAYFGAGGDPIKAFDIWEGGLGIWGAVAGGALGAWIAARQLGMPLSVVADALAPGLPLAQAIGRLGNWFNNELYGGRTTLPWGLRGPRHGPGQPRATRSRRRRQAGRSTRASTTRPSSTRRCGTSASPALVLRRSTGGSSSAGAGRSRCT